jgi:membrane protein YdbS with pleckstrin-like domain
MRPVPLNQLNRKIVSVWRVNNLITTVVMGILFFGTVVGLRIGLSISLLWFIPPAVIFVLQLLLSILLFPPIRYARWRYEVTADEIDIMEGLFFINRTIIPIVRVQFSDTAHGPVLRAFGLASVTIVTAGGEHSIPGLLTEEADALRDQIAALAKNLQEGV